MFSYVVIGSPGASLLAGWRRVFSSEFPCTHSRGAARFESVMKVILIARVLVFGAAFAVSACTAVVDRREPRTTSTTTTEETTVVHPLRGATSQTTTTISR